MLHTVVHDLLLHSSDSRGIDMLNVLDMQALLMSVFPGDS